jgi:hypothetical protein
MSESYYHMTAKEVMESLIKDLQDAHIKMKGYPHQRPARRAHKDEGVSRSI